MKQKERSVQNEESLLLTQPDQYVFRQIFEFQPYEYIKQVAFHDDLDRFKKWRMSQVRYDTEFGVTFAPAKDGTLDIKKIEEDEAVAKKIITKILKERKNKRPVFNATDLQMEYLQGLNHDGEVSDYYHRVSTGLQMSEHQFSPRNGSNAGDNSNRMRKGQTMPLVSNNQKKEQLDKVGALKKKQQENIERQLKQIIFADGNPRYLTHTKNYKMLCHIHATR